MAYYKKGVGLVKAAYKSNLEARSANLDFVAGKYAIQPAAYGIDVITSVSINDKSIGKALITNPSSLISIDLPAEYTAIGPKAFDGCSNLESIYIYAGHIIPISEDAIPSGCTIYVDYEFVAEYQAEHPTLTFAGFDSGYVYTIPYIEGITPTTLTAQYVNDCVATLGDAKNFVGKVIIPSGFTNSEVFTDTQFKNWFQNIEVVSFDGMLTNIPMADYDGELAIDEGYVYVEYEYLVDLVDDGYANEKYIQPMSFHESRRFVIPHDPSQTKLTAAFVNSLEVDETKECVYLDEYWKSFDSGCLNGLYQNHPNLKTFLAHPKGMAEDARLALTRLTTAVGSMPYFGFDYENYSDSTSPFNPIMQGYPSTVILTNAIIFYRHIDYPKTVKWAWASFSASTLRLYGMFVENNNTTKVEDMYYQSTLNQDIDLSKWTALDSVIITTSDMQNCGPSTKKVIYHHLPATSAKWLNFGRKKVFFMNMPSVPIVTSNHFKGTGINIYVPSTILTSILEDTTQGWATIVADNNMVGFIDNPQSFPTFTGYSATWYSDEDCTNVILTPISGRNFVKLTANA